MLKIRFEKLCATLLLATLPLMALATNQSFDPKLEFVEPRNEKVTVTELSAAYPDACLRVQAELTNAAADAQQIAYRFHWYDVSGNEVAEASPWISMTIPGNQAIAVQGKSPSAQALDFRLELQAPVATP